MDRPSVLLIAEAANPEWVSVPLIGWSLAEALREVAEVHLVTQVRNRDAILRQGWIEGENFTALDTEAVTRPIWRLAQVFRRGSGVAWTLNTAVNSLVYPYFERRVWREFGSDLRTGRFDLVHRITPLTPTAVSPIARKCHRIGVPFVLGPLNGGVPWPDGFSAERSREREWLSHVRHLYRLGPGRGAMFRSSNAVLAGSRHTESEFPTTSAPRTIYLPENAIDPTRFNKRAAQDISGPIRACFIGRLVPYKGPDMLLEAAAPLLRSGRLLIDVIGDGPLRPDLEALVRRESIGHAVTFYGQVPHEQVQDIAVACNMLTFPSIREFGGGVVLEAMALGVVPLVVDYAGPGELVTPGTGITVPIGSRDRIIADLRSAIHAVVEDPSGLPEMAVRAHARAHEHFTWPAKARQVRQVYDWVLSGGGPAPEVLPG